MSRPIADILRDAREAHQRYRDAVPHRVADGSGGTIAVAGDPEAARVALADAYALRLEAEHADVTGVSPEWTTEGTTHPHYDLLKFYADQHVAPEFAPGAVAAAASSYWPPEKTPLELDVELLKSKVLGD